MTNEDEEKLTPEEEEELKAFVGASFPKGEEKAGQFHFFNKVVNAEDSSKVANLSEEELMLAMQRLGIQKLEITPEDREVITRSRQPVRELSRDEIVAAMKRLGITKLEGETGDWQARSKPLIPRKSRFCIYCGNALSSNGLDCPKCGKQR